MGMLLLREIRGYGENSKAMSVCSVVQKKHRKARPSGRRPKESAPGSRQCRQQPSQSHMAWRADYWEVYILACFDAKCWNCRCHKRILSTLCRAFRPYFVSCRPKRGQWSRRFAFVAVICACLG